MRPIRRIANRSAATLTSAGTGRTSIWSKLPSRIRRPSASALPTSRSAAPSTKPDMAYSSATWAMLKPPKASMWPNMMMIAAKSRNVITSCTSAPMTKDVRYVSDARTHAPAIIANPRTASATLDHHLADRDPSESGADPEEQGHPEQLHPDQRPGGGAGVL